MTNRRVVLSALCALACGTQAVWADSQSYLGSDRVPVAGVTAPAAIPGGPTTSASLTWFDNKADFEAAAGAMICLEDFEENTMPGGADLHPDVIESDVPCNPQPCHFPQGLTGCDGMAYQTNDRGGAPDIPSPTPGGFVLALLTAGFGGVSSDVLIADRFPMSIDVVLKRDDVFGFGSTPVSLAGGQTVDIRVYDVDNTFLGMKNVPVRPNGSFFFGVISDDAAIGRVNVFDPFGGNNGAEGFDNVQIHGAGGPEQTCVYYDKRIKARGGCGACPVAGECGTHTEAVCASVEECGKKITAVIDCPDGKGGECKITRQRMACVE